ncbi:monocarboxylate transporter 11-like [Asterias rubens]|uniref:monocarboxylate transporter 11-like n=1 Tax=Asterias rubens TaxID=7604 RepID=UPI00145509C7|nr:monocarboxylate transporter 11-like [Asterias rubens]
MKPGCFERILHLVTDTLQDGGLHGWIAVLCLFAVKIAWTVLAKGMGMMLPTLQEQFVTSTWLIGWMVAFVNAGGFSSEVLATPLKERFGARAVLTVCGLVAGISMITASFLSNLYVITFILTIFAAYGVTGLGDTFAFLIAVPSIQLFLYTYGWRGTMLLLGALLLHLAVFGALVKPPADSGSLDGYEAALTDEEQETMDNDVEPSNRFGCSCFAKVFSLTRDTFQLEVFLSISFVLVLFVFIVMELTYCSWLIYYVQLLSPTD